MSSAGADPTGETADLVITRVFDAPRELVWRAWTEHEHLVRWSAPHGFTIPESETRGEVRSGGHWHSCMVSPDGIEHRLGGVYREVVPMKRLSFTHAWDGEDGRPGRQTLVSVDFEDDGEGRTRMKFRQTGFGSDASRDGHREGWEESFDRLAELVGALTTESPAASTADREIVVTRVFDAPRELVWKVWTDADNVTHWWGPRGFTTTTHATDFRVGGIWRFTMHGPDGTDYPNDVRYTEIVAPERLVYDHGSDDGGDPNFHVTVTFHDQGGRTRVALRMLAPTVEARQEMVKFGAVEGGNQTLDRLGELLAAR